MPDAITVVRLPNPQRRDPVALLIDAVARHSLVLTDALHADNEIRPYSCVRHEVAVDVVSFSDTLTEAILRGNPYARLVTRLAPAAITSCDLAPERMLLSFATATHFKVKGVSLLEPTSARLIGSLSRRWQAAGWPVLPFVDPAHVRMEILRYQRIWPYRVKSDVSVPGFRALVSCDLRQLSGDARRAFAQIVAFGMWRGVGSHTTYGMGRLMPWGGTLDEWPGTCIAPWQAVDRGRGTARRGATHAAR